MQPNMKMLQQMQNRMAKIQEELAEQTVSADAGGGMVTVEADGKGQIRKIKIDASVVDPKDVEMLEDLVLVAIGEAQRKATEMVREEMKGLTGGLPLPFNMPPF